MQDVPLSAESKQQWDDFEAKHPGYLQQFSVDLQEQLALFWILSPFAYKTCLNFPELLLTLSSKLSKSYLDLLAAIDVRDQDLLCISQKIYEFRCQQLTRIAWRQLILQDEMSAIFKETSDLADAIILFSLERCYESLTKIYTPPAFADGQPMFLYVMALGKLGGQELNFSSDIDLIFAYPEDGIQITKNKEFTHQAFFLKLARLFIDLIDNTKAGWSTFRIDMRLRPYGSNGALVSNLNSLERYYQEQGRDWERYALIKARIINEDHEAQVLKQMLKAFVYRRYLDYSAFSALRQMKQLITEQAKTANYHHDVKRGAGRIREAEFIVQALQMIKGGREPSLQTMNFLDAAKACMEKKLLSTLQWERLQTGYLFFRKMENVLQIYQDQQTHLIPLSGEMQRLIALGMHYPNWDLCYQDLLKNQKNISAIFNEIVMPEKIAEIAASFDYLAMDVKSDQIKREVEQLGFTDPEQIVEGIEKLRQFVYSREPSAISRQRLSDLLPLLLKSLSEQVDGHLIFPSILKILILSIRRSAYLVLLFENPKALTQLIKLCQQSPWLAEQIAHYPLLLDDLLDSQRDLSIDEGRVQLLLDYALAKTDPEDLEQQMLILREFKLSQIFNTAVSQINDELTSKAVGLKLVNLAKVILKSVLKIAWHHVVTKFGYLPEARTLETCHFTIIGYGNLGSGDMHYQSDIDIVMLHDYQAAHYTSGKKSISVLEFYAKLAQRIVNLLSAPTISGVIYEVDLRLRPSGDKGLLVSGIDSFFSYQNKQAWTFEHQALIRAKAICGDFKAMKRFEENRVVCLQNLTNTLKIKKNILEMRGMLQTQHKDTNNLKNMIKFCPGGIVDINFMVQYFVLMNCAKESVLLESTETIILLALLAKKHVISPDTAAELTSCYQQYLAKLQIIALEGTHQVVRYKAETAACRTLVSQYWQELVED